MKKLFNEWFPVKSFLDTEKKRPLFNEGEVWMSNIGVNIGYEVNGKNTKGSDFLRPIFILRKLSHHTFIGIPLSGKEKIGDWFFPLSINGRSGVLLFNQVQHSDAKRLKYRMERIDEKKIEEIKIAFKNFI